MQASEEIKSRLDIVDIIRDYIQLQNAGSNFRARCPFHQEKTPSFMVSPEKQIWHCFGCGKGGDVLEFVKEIEGISFAETLRLLAPKAGVELKKQDPKETSRINRALDIMELCRNYYHRVLLDSKGAQAARDYLAKRGVDADVMEEWQMGYSPEGWDNVYTPLRKKGFHDEEIFNAGISLKRNNSSGYYDRFRGRIMFPINDVNGRTVAFTARVSPEKEKTEKMGKYINSPQTDLYNKSGILFGLDKAKLEIKNQGYAIIVEGQMDVITAHKYGFKNVVASSGTALTIDQLNLLKRYTKQIIMAFDMDDAGIQAAEKGIEEALKMGMKVKIASLPEGKDPDECIRKNTDSWRSALKEAKYVMDYYFDKTFYDLDPDRHEDREKVRISLLPHIFKLTDEIEKDFWIKKISEKMGVDESSIRRTVISIGEVSGNEKNRSNNEIIKKNNVLSVKPLSREERLSELVLAAMLKHLSLLEYVMNHTETNHLLGDGNVAIYKKLIFYYNNNINNQSLNKSSSDDLFDYFNFKEWLLNEDQENGKNQSALLDRLVLLSDKEFYGLELSKIKENIINSVLFLKRNYIARRMKEIEADIREEEKKGSKERIAELLEEFKILSDELSSL